MRSFISVLALLLSSTCFVDAEKYRVTVSIKEWANDPHNNVVGLLETDGESATLSKLVEKGHREYPEPDYSFLKQTEQIWEEDNSFFGIYLRLGKNWKLCVIDLGGNIKAFGNQGDGDLKAYYARDRPMTAEYLEFLQ